jgi:hypothetical protein
MTRDEIESSEKWANDPGPISEEDLEVSDEDFEMWRTSDVKPGELVNGETRARYERYLLKHV